MWTCDLREESEHALSQLQVRGNVRAADERADFGLKCRIYRSEHGMSGVPTDECVRAALAASTAPHRSQTG